MPNFETFHRHLPRMKRTCSVTFRASGDFTISAQAFDLIGRPSYLELLYDARERLVGFRGTEEGSPHGYRVRGVKGGNFTVTGKAFLRYHNIFPTRSERRPAVLQDGLLCVDLKQPGTPVRSNRAAAA